MAVTDPTRVHNTTIIALLRQAADNLEAVAAAPLSPASGELWRFGRLEVDEPSRQARVDGHALALTPREFSLLATLARNARLALSRDYLVQSVWGLDFLGDERTLDVHVCRLRRKIERAYGLPPMFRTVQRLGYRFEPPTEVAA
jgi:DNA-binding response OmpR family regulator